jgi:hypothetical protein
MNQFLKKSQFQAIRLLPGLPEIKAAVFRPAVPHIKSWHIWNS